MYTWFSVKGQFTPLGHIPKGGRPLLREGTLISYQPRPEATSPPEGGVRDVHLVCGLGLRVLGQGFGVRGSGFMFWVLGFGFWGLHFCV